MRVRALAHRYLQTLTPTEALLLGLIPAAWIGSLLFQISFHSLGILL